MNDHGSERGSILLLVVWIVAVMAILAAMLSVRTKVFIRNTAYLTGRTTGFIVLEGAIQRSLYDILALPAMKDLEPADRNRIRFEYEIGGEMVTVYKVPASAKLSVHNIRQQVWKEVFMLYDLSEEEAMEIVASVQDWVDKDGLLHPGGAEDDHYQAGPFPYYPHNDKILDLRELMLIKGITEEMYYGSEELPALQDFFTDREGGNKLDINTAPGNLIQGLTGALDEEMQELLHAREEEPFQTIQETQEFLGPNAFSKAVRHFTTTDSADIMTLRATLKRGRQTIALEETFQISGRVIKWLERREWTY